MAVAKKALNEKEVKEIMSKPEGESIPLATEINSLKKKLIARLDTPSAKAEVEKIITSLSASASAVIEKDGKEAIKHIKEDYKKLLNVRKEIQDVIDKSNLSAEYKKGLKHHSAIAGLFKLKEEMPKGWVTSQTQSSRKSLLKYST